MNPQEIINQLGEERARYFGAAIPPIVQSSNFVFKSVADLRASMEDEHQFPIYTRGCNPTVAILRQKLAALEGAEDALVFSSGVAAISSAVMASVRAGDHIVCIEKPYGWTGTLLGGLLERFGVELTSVDGRSAASYEAAMKPNTRLFFLESPNSWSFEVQDLEGIARLAKSRGITTVIDNSYSSPLFQNPLKFGIDIVAHSASKYIGGHSDVVAGFLCASQAIIKKIFHMEFMTLGGTISPNDAWLLLRGLRTLPLRMERFSKSTYAVVDALAKDPRVEKIFYPTHPSHSQFALAQKQMSGGGSLFSMQLKAKDEKQVEAFCNRLKHFLIACSWGGFESLVFPACAHRSPDGTYCKPWNMVRFSVGLEDPEVLIADIQQALEVL